MSRLTAATRSARTRSPPRSPRQTGSCASTPAPAAMSFPSRWPARTPGPARWVCLSIFGVWLAARWLEARSRCSSALLAGGRVIEVSVSQGHVALIDDFDYELVAPYSWLILRGKNGVLYARRVWEEHGRQRTQRMHSLIT